VHYPIGTSEVNGVDTDNFVVAQSLINSLQASGAIAVPRKLAPHLQDTGVDKEDAWVIELLSDNSQGRASFTEREKYLDSLKLRSVGLPERSGIEGQFGTKAEAEAHGDFALTVMSLRGVMIAQNFNCQVIDDALELNWGREARGMVYAVANPLLDNSKNYLSTVYTSLMSDPDLRLVEADGIDTAVIKDKLGIPRRDEVDDDRDLPRV
jgi:hypothetical protein